jgi:hypothetical protein
MKMKRWYFTTRGEHKRLVTVGFPAEALVAFYRSGVRLVLPAREVRVGDYGTAIDDEGIRQLVPILRSSAQRPSGKVSLRD